MAASGAIVQALHHELAETRQKIVDIDAMCADLSRLAVELDGQVKVEEGRLDVVDINHFAYPTSARAAMLRRDNLLSSVAELVERRQDLSALAVELENRCTDAEQRARRA